ncbi:NADH-quinone oxidoreductase subunit D [Herpetosiphon geysericola]|uniref:NADH-quinone oxidoreductase subunit D n=1 Tax=Herpetosiphon geysericola TaxID=70996 RepID=A0A0N8GPM7_9CHLR|nr:NADH-quinone oxidoreductase subunit D [Herpetosiphon geysericola]KPL81330.1 NADH dehydrogenase [Herpetosiphon geysericola]
MLKTEELQINIGPQHPSTHGVFRMLVTVDGETLVDLKPVFGYLHRNHEQLGEVNTYLQNMPFTDRLDYFNSMVNNHAYARTVETLAGVEVPERAQYIRVIMDELSRILNHATAMGFMLGDMGAWQTALLWGMREREKILDMFEYVSGARMMCNYCRFGGVVRDIDDWFITELKKLMQGLPHYFDDFEGLLLNSEILLARARNIGVLPKELALAYSVTGPVLRGSGVAYDIRKAEPYAVYDRFKFKVPVGTVGDVYDRFLVRIAEMRESYKILEQALEQLPDATGGFINPKVKQQSLKAPAGEAYARVESPKGELGFYVVSDGTGSAYRYKVRAPSFINLSALADMCKGYTIADVVVILGSIDIVMGEVDR